MDKVITSEKVLVGGDINVHVNSDMSGFVGFGIRQINDEKEKSAYNIEI